MHLSSYSSRVTTNPENQEKSGNLTVVREKSGKMCFACGVLPQLRWSQSKPGLTAWVLLSADDMSVMDCQRSKQKLVLPIHIIVIMFYSSHLLIYGQILVHVSCLLTSAPGPICIQLLVCRKHLKISENLTRTGNWPPCSLHIVNLWLQFHIVL